MNKTEVSKLQLSEDVYHDDLNREFKTYRYEDKEHRLYGLLTTSRLDGETQFEYKVRRIFMKQRVDNALTSRMIWHSKNSSNMRLYQIARRLTKVEDMSKIEKIKENAIASNLGTLDKKKLNKIVEEINKQN